MASPTRQHANGFLVVRIFLEGAKLRLVHVDAVYDMRVTSGDTTVTNISDR